MPALHPLFEPEILDEVLRLQQDHLRQQQEVQDDQDQSYACGTANVPYVVERTAADVCGALNNLARCYQGLRDDMRGMQQLLIRVIDILAEART